jgi:hypothetical protein
MCTLLRTWQCVHYCVRGNVYIIAHVAMCTLLRTWQCVHYCTRGNVYIIAYVAMCTLLRAWQCVHYCVRQLSRDHSEFMAKLLTRSLCDDLSQGAVDKAELNALQQNRLNEENR